MKGLNIANGIKGLKSVDDVLITLMYAFPKTSNVVTEFSRTLKSTKNPVKALQSGLSALSTTAKATMGTMAALLAVFAVIKGIDWVLDKNNDSTEELLENRTEILSDLSDIEGELDTVNSQLEELESQKLTITNPQDIETLNTQIDLLKQRQKLLEGKKKNSITKDKLSAQETIDSTHTADVYSGAIYSDNYSGKWSKVHSFLNGGSGESNALEKYSAAGYIDYLEKSLLTTVKSSNLDNVSDNLSEIQKTYSDIIEDDNLIGTKAYDEATAQLQKVNELLEQVYYRQSIENSLDFDVIKAGQLDDLVNLTEEKYNKAFNSLIQKSYELNEAITSDDIKEAFGDDYEYLENALSQQNKSIEDYITWINAAIAANIDFAKTTEEASSSLDMSKVADWGAKLDQSSKENQKSLNELNATWKDWLDELDDSEKEIAYAIFLEDDGAIQSLSDYQNQFNEIVNNPDKMTIYANRIYDDMTLIQNGFNSATKAKTAFENAMDEVVEYDTNFNSYTDALNTLQEEYERGAFNSKTSKLAASYLLGEDFVNNHTAAEIEKQIDSLIKFYGKYENAEGELEDTFGFGFLEELNKLDLSDFETTIEKMSDGSYKFSIDPSEVEVLAKKLGITEEGAWACIEALQMMGEVELFNEDSFKDFINRTQKVGEQYKNLSGTLSNGKQYLDVDMLKKKFEEMGWDIEMVQAHLDNFENSGGVLLSFSGTIDDICDSLKQLGLISKDATGKVNVDFEQLVSTLGALGKTNEEIYNIVDKLNSSNKVTLTFEGETDNVQKQIEELKDKADKESDSIRNSVQSALDGIQLHLDWTDLLHGNITIKADANIKEAEEKLNNLNKQKNVTGQDTNFNVNADNTDANKKLNDTQSKKKETGANVKFDVNAIDNASSILSNILNSVKSIAGKAFDFTISLFGNGGGSGDGKKADGKGSAYGYNNKSYANGTKKNGNDLISEVEPEIHVHAKDGTWELVDHPQFTTVEKDDIVFDGKQTKKLLKNGNIDTWGSWGSSFVNGTSGNAYAIDGKLNGKTPNNAGSSTKKSSTKSKASSSSKSSSSKSSNKDEKEPQVFDWIEVALSRIQRTIDNLSKKAESTFKKLSTRLKATNDEVSNINKEINLQQKAADRYMKEANSVGLSSSLAKQVREGTININEYSEETQELIKDYQNWYEKSLACKDAVADLHEELASLYEDKFNNIQNDYENQLKLLEHSANIYNTGIDRLEAKGYLESTKYYSALQSVEKQNIAVMNKELKDLEKSLADALNSGEIEKYSDSWYNMKVAINETKESIDEANVSLLKYSKTIQEIEWSYFEYTQDRISQITQEADFLIDLMSDDKLHQDNGQFNDKGMATTGLHAQNYNVYMAQADMYAKQVADINKKIAKDKNNTTLIEQKEAYIKLQQESIIAAKNEKNAIKDLVEEGINIELDALKDLMDAYTDSLDSAKDLYDYQKKIADKTSDIAALEKQLSAIQYDTSEENKARIQKLQVELKDAKEDLEETEYDQYISDQKKLLDDLYNEYETILNMRLDNIDALMSQMITDVNSNSSTINTTLQSIAGDVGTKLSTEMTKIWGTKNIDQVVADYSNNFNKEDTTINKTLNGIKANTDAMIKASDKEQQKDVKKDQNDKKGTQNNASSQKNTQSKTSTSKSTSTKTKRTTQDNYGVALAIINGNYGWGTGNTRKKNLTAKGFDYNTVQSIVDKMMNDGYVNSGAWKGKYYGIKDLKPYHINKYKTGGLVDYTGLAQLDGTPSKPELVLNSNDTKNFLALTEALRNTTLQPFEFKNNFSDFGNLSDILNNIKAKENFGNNQGVTFGDINLEIPIDHVSDYNDFITQLQKDNKVVNMIQDMTVKQIFGGSKLAKNRYQFKR